MSEQVGVAETKEKLNMLKQDLQALKDKLEKGEDCALVAEQINAKIKELQSLIK